MKSDDLDKTEKTMLVAIGLCLALVAVSFVGSLYKWSAEKDFMRECLADGHKHYECVAMQRGK